MTSPHPPAGAVRPGAKPSVGRCNWNACSVTENLTLFAGGRRCPGHTPAALKGAPEPAELAAKAAANRAKPAADPCALCGQPVNRIYAEAGAHPWCAENERN